MASFLDSLSSVGRQSFIYHDISSIYELSWQEKTAVVFYYHEKRCDYEISWYKIEVIPVLRVNLMN